MQNARKLKRSKTMAAGKEHEMDLKFKQILQIFTNNQKIQISIDPNEEEEDEEQQESEHILDLGDDKKSAKSAPAELEHEDHQIENEIERLNTREREIRDLRKRGIVIYEGENLFNITKVWSLTVDNVVLPKQE